MTKAIITNSIVSAQWLAENLSVENLILFDASMKPIFPVANPSPETPAYIPGSLRFDFDDVLCDHDTPLPHMMPSPESFTEEMQKMGVDNDSAIVVYDKVGIYSSPRAWWMFRAMGHNQVAVLDGGLPAWIQAGYGTVPTLATPKGRGNFASQPQGGLFVDSSYVVQALADSAFRVIDARSAGRFKGQEPEPRAGLRGGHMPNAVNIPYADVLENGLMSPTSKLQSIFEQYKGKRMIFSCGSGVTACVVALAAEQAGYKDLAVYDGSWSEWGLPDSGLPVVKD
ncbi:MAG TPA: sulfurtransferase [Anaerolineales bacterium]|nr:sulfurtransferase [Anaerolineales bacterium]